VTQLEDIHVRIHKTLFTYVKLSLPWTALLANSVDNSLASCLQLMLLPAVRNIMHLF